MSNEIVPLLDENSAKAVEETAKLGQDVVGAITGASSYLKEVSSGIPQNLAGMLGDAVLHWRVRNRVRLEQRTREILANRGVKSADRDSSPSVVVPIYEAAMGESSDDLSELWARLLAAAMDPKRSVRKRFIEAVREMDPVDARVFQKLAEHAHWTPSSLVAVASALGLQTEEVTVSFQNLYRIGCIEHSNANLVNPHISAFGNLLLTAIRN